MSHGNRSESTFAHYLNQCWFLLCEVLWHLTECPGYNHVQWVWKSYFKNYSLISKHFEPYAFFMKSFTFSFEIYGMISWGSNIRPNSHIPQCTVPHSTLHISEQKCAHFCSGWCIVGCRTGTLWDLWDLSFDNNDFLTTYDNHQGDMPYWFLWTTWMCYEWCKHNETNKTQPDMSYLIHFVAWGCHSITEI